MATSRELVETASELGSLSARVELARDVVRAMGTGYDANLRDMVDRIDADLAMVAKRIIRAAGRVGDLFAIDAYEKDHAANAQRTSDK